MQRAMYALRKDTSRLRKVAVPMREVLGTLIRRDQDIVGDHVLAPYYADVRDHVLRVGEGVEAVREMRLAQQGFRLDEVMKRITSWAAIIAVPTLITGFYGQNLPFPGSGEPWGFWVSTVLVAVVSVSLYSIFKRNDWL
jgi:magnesium transporter